ncbi:hypothetical protein [Octadecabacter antarcticus]|uniref:hypothetical protein n=1 Tax=Octadecabacter antarcticus TaxID=1217908 RepID=UPI001181A744|nr:hypothetical protein [Octadecabacter antarcticus]
MQAIGHTATKSRFIRTSEENWRPSNKLDANLLVIGLSASRCSAPATLPDEGRIINLTQFVVFCRLPLLQF